MKLNIKALQSSAIMVANRGVFSLKKHSPKILTGLGIVGGIGSTVLACKATLKAQYVIKAHNAACDDIKDVIGCKLTDNGKYTEEVAKKDIHTLYMMTGKELLKLYAPAISLGALSATSILYGNHILSKRNASLAAAYKLLDTGFKEYRRNVVERYGESVDKELRYGLVKEKIEEEVTDPETGKKKKVKKEVQVLPNGKVPSVYARIFDETNDNYVRDDELNLFFINGQLQYWNHVLQTRGYVFLNEVYNSLGFRPTKAGQHVGWYYDPKNPKSDDYIDFGIYDVSRPKAADFVNGYERSVILDFNVQGPIDSLVGDEI